MGERECVGGFWRRCGRQFGRRATTMPYLPMDSRPPVDHSCVGRNLFFTGRHRRLNLRRRWRHMFKIDSCLRRNGLPGDGGLLAYYGVGNAGDGELRANFGIVAARRPNYANAFCIRVIASSKAVSEVAKDNRKQLSLPKAEPGTAAIPAVSKR